jgi:hypothetical protein
MQLAPRTASEYLRFSLGTVHRPRIDAPPVQHHDSADGAARGHICVSHTRLKTQINKKNKVQGSTCLQMAAWIIDITLRAAVKQSDD